MFLGGEDFMAMKHVLSPDDFEREVLCADEPVVVYFPAPVSTCDNKERIEAELERFSRRNARMKVAKAETHTARFFVSGAHDFDKLPCWILFKDCNNMRSTTEFRNAEGLERWVGDLLPEPPTPESRQPRPKVVSLADRRALRP